MGHAVAIRLFGGRPRITLYHFGGLAVDDRYDRSAREQIIISAAGPMAGFLLAAIVVITLAVAGKLEGFTLGLVPVQYELFDRPTVDRATLEPRLSLRDQVVWSLLFVNFAWGLVNLLPVYPLDGGRIAREVLVEHDAHRGVVRSLWLSMITAGAFGVYALIAWGGLFVPLMFGMLAVGSYQMLQAQRGRGW
jgi:membrane-associated protease RseP (regulator of RpoE activity)